MNSSADHILVHMQSFASGGVERVALALAQAWLDSGRRVTLVVGAAAGPLTGEVPRTANLITGTGPGYISAAGLAIDSVKHLSPDVIFCPGNHYSAVAVAMKLRLGRACPPIVCKVSNAVRRSDYHPAGQAAYRLWLRLQRPFIDHYTALSPALRREFIEVTACDPARVAVVRDPLIAAVSDDGPQPANSSAPLVLAIGRLAPQKRFDRLVEAMATLPTDLDWRLVILGEGPERPRIAAAIARHGLGARIEMPGHVADVGPWLRSARLLALSSSFEGLPAVLFEALSCGTPIVATAASVAIVEALASAELGTVVPVDDFAALGHAITERLRADHDRAGLAARVAFPSPRDSASAYLDIFDRLVRQR